MRTIPLFLLALILVAVTGCAPSGESPKAASESASPGNEGKRAVTAEKINLNEAPVEEFLTIPGVGERMAGEFDEYRPYISILEFRREMGKYVDEETIAAYEDHVYVPIDINASDVATVAQILGMDEAGAEQIVAARPYASQEDFVAKVTEVAGGISAQFARLYLASE
jgi:DNA uptake protein ComE-like DNA-binding protein